MSDDTNHGDRSASVAAYQSANISAEVDAMVAARGNAKPVTVKKDRPASVSYNSATGELRVLSGTLDANADAPIPDDGTDLMATQTRAIAEYDALKAKYEAVEFDPKTGEPRFALPDAERAVLKMQLDTLHGALTFQAHRFLQIQQQREQQQAAREAADRTRLAREEFARGDKALYAIWDEEAARDQARARIASLKARS